jgi:hypothetical protein
VNEPPHGRTSTGITMRRLGLLLLPLCIACDLPDKDIGDSGNVGESNDEGGEGGEGSTGGSETEGDESGQACTLIGCDDGLFVTIRHQGLWDGNYQFQLTDADVPVIGCDFNVVSGLVEDSDCLLYGPPSAAELVLQLPIAEDPGFVLSYQGAVLESSEIAVEYMSVYPNGPECDEGCTQGSWTLEIGSQAGYCEGLEQSFWAEYETVRGCSEASECGQIMEGTGCGCTRAWIARNDADLDRFYELWTSGSNLACDWALFGSTCDCPEADGFACVENICTWNYL